MNHPMRYVVAVAAASGSMIVVPVMGMLWRGASGVGGAFEVVRTVFASIVVLPFVALVVGIVAAPASILALWIMRRFGWNGAWWSIAAGVVVALASSTLMVLYQWTFDPLPPGVPAATYWVRWRDAVELAIVPGAIAGWTFHRTHRW